MSEEKTISELSEIDGAFNKGNVYECAYAYHRWFAVGVYYECDGRGIFDNSGRVWANGGRSKFKLVTPKEEVKTMRTPFNLERAIAGDKVVNKRGCEYNQFSVIKTRIKDVISCYSVEANDVYRYSEKDVNTILFMAPKMGKGFVNVYGDYICMNGYDTRKLADEYATYSRVMCIDLSQFPEGYGL
tara:strand:+ start:98 stop:655 length:558 start_codon:yes stop_codon:yes gene_type:complete